MFSDPRPKNGDSDNNLLSKIAQILFSSSPAGGTSSLVSGAVSDNAAETEKPIPVAGKAVTSASYAPVYADGDRATLAVDKTSGGLLTHTRQLTAATDAVAVSGDVAHDAVDSGAPIKLGGKAYTGGNEPSPSGVANLDRVDAHFDQFGRLHVVNSGMVIESYLSLAARTSTPAAQAARFNTVGKGLSVFINVTAATGTPNLVVTVEALDPTILTTGVALVATAAINTTGLRRLVVYPGVLPVANQAVSDVLPRYWRITAVHGSADSITYSIAAMIQI